jgi:signal transduction histidine kinase/ActR/RegA family two-component response regulator
MLVDDGAELKLNPPASRLVAPEHAARLEEAVQDLVAPEQLAAARKAIAGARAGSPARQPLGSGRVLVALPLPPGGVTVLLLQEAASEKSLDAQAGVAHELANALGAIAGWARLAREGTQVEHALSLIEKSAEGAWEAARRLLGEASSSVNEALNLSTFVQEIAELLAPRAEQKKVRVVARVAPGMRVAANRGYAWSIVWNLAINAIDAVNEGGKVELTLSSRGPKVVLQVIDNGCGMDEATAERVFEQYFTTKVEGTGLGLALVKQTVEELGGSIALDSAPGQGTRFTVELPRVRRAGGRVRASGVYYAGPLTGRLLVVDDDAGVRELLATALRSRGADVTIAGSPEEARAAQGPFDLAILDVRMPEMRGDELLAELRALGIVQRGMLVSGAEQPKSFAPGGRPDAMLRKPFDLDDLFRELPEELRDPEADSPSIRLI